MGIGGGGIGDDGCACLGDDCGAVVGGDGCVSDGDDDDSGDSDEFLVVMSGVIVRVVAAVRMRLTHNLYIGIRPGIGNLEGTVFGGRERELSFVKGKR